MKNLFAFLIMFLLSINVYPQKKELIYLWPDKVPGELKEKQPPAIDTTNNDNILRYSEVTNPAIEVFLPDPATKNGSAVIVCPGGGYQILAYDLEGTEIPPGSTNWDILYLFFNTGYPIKKKVLYRMFSVQ